MPKTFPLQYVLKFSLLLAASPSLAAVISVYLSAPGVQQTYVPGATVESFESNPVGLYSDTYSSPIGTYALTTNVPFAITGPDAYGGANSSNYMAFGAQTGTSSPIVLNLNNSYNYFGFWWPAGDGNNAISFFLNGLLLARFDTSDILSLLSQTTITALNGSTYNSSAYFGNPNNALNPSEPYAFIHFISTGVNFNTIVFDNSGTAGTGFESDNHTVYSGFVPVDQATVLVKTVETQVPEPSTLALAAFSLLALAAASPIPRPWSRADDKHSCNRY